MNKNIKKSDISWVEPTEPSFLKKFKSDVGYKEGPNVDTKVCVLLARYIALAAVRVGLYHIISIMDNHIYNQPIASCK